MGLTISITLPEPVEKFYKEQAEKQDVSRSKVIRNILVANYEDKKKAEQKKYGDSPNKCNHRPKSGMCPLYDFPCNASEVHAKTCPDYIEE